MQKNILIVGAGPTGLILGCELLSQGIPCRMIDRLEKPINTSRSFTIHARTLELLEKLGLAEKFIESGHFSYSMDYHFAGKDEIPKINFRELDSEYPYVLIINQADTEAILREHFLSLGGEIEWNRRLTGLSQANENHVDVEIQDTKTEAVEQASFAWVLGCDGFYSAVRRNLDLPFDGEEHAGEMKMMDVALEGFPLSHEAIYYFITKEHMLLMTKLPGKNYRVLISDTGQGASTETARDDFQRVVDLHFQGAVVLAEPEWTTVFKTAKRKTDTYQQGRVFLAGDAAHVNSPAGGQGMNVSMQDAFNLGWKLALVEKGLAQDSILDTYGQERLPIAAQMHEGTQYIHSIIMAHGRGMEERIALTKAPDWNRKAVNQIAGISYTYRQAEDTSSISAGDRAPNLPLAEGKLYHFVDNLQPTLFIILKKEAVEEDYQAAYDLSNVLCNLYPIKAEIIAPQEQESSLFDQTGAVASIFNALADNQLVLIRPDRYIGFYGTSPDELESYLETILVKQS